MPLEAGKQSKPRRSKAARKPFSKLDGAKWLRVGNGEISSWTSAEALRRAGFDPARIERLAARKFCLDDAKSARPFAAASFLMLLCVDDAWIHDAGDA